MATGPGGTGGRQREEVPAGPGGGPAWTPDRRSGPRSTTPCCSTCRAGDPAPRHPPAGVGLLRRDPPGEAPEGDRYFRPGSPPNRSPAASRPDDEITAVLEDSVAKHMRADVTVGAFLSGASTPPPSPRWRSGTTPADHVHHRFRAGGFLRGRRRGGLRRGHRCPARHQGGQPGPEFVAACPRSSGISTSRWPTRRWCRCSSSPARPASTSRWCCPARAPTSCSAATPSIGSRLSLKHLRLSPRARCARRWARPRPLPEGMRGKSLLHRGSLTLEERYYGNARSFSDDPSAGGPARLRPDWTHTDVTAPIYAESRGLGSGGRVCSTSTCSPGCAATSWSRPTR